MARVQCLMSAQPCISTVARYDPFISKAAFDIISRTEHSSVWMMVEFVPSVHRTNNPK